MDNTKKEFKFLVMGNIYNQLVGNWDYIDNRIVLNVSSTRNDGTEKEVHPYIFNDNISDLEIKIFI